MSTTHGGRRLLAAAGAVALAAAVTVPADAAPPEGRGKPEPRPHYQLTILHNNDGESKLLNAPGQPDFGGVARFATLVDQLRAEALVRTPWDRTTAPRSGVVLLSSGDNFLAGPEFTASLEKGVPFYDSIALDHIGYDAFAIGNHEFDFGPDVLADFISGIDAPFVSANLDVSAEPALAALAADGSIVASTVVRESGARIGVVGATTPALPSISSPRNVEVLSDVAGLVQEQVDTLTSKGVRIIVLISHLQNVEEDRDLISTLRDVDVAIAGGGDELLANDGDLLVPGDVRTLDPDTGQPLPYPIIEKDADGQQVPIVTTAGDYKYVGRLVVDFDTHGEVVRVHDSSGPVRVSGVAPDAVAPDPFITEQVVEPVADFVSDLAENVIAQSQVALEGRRAFVRTSETNLGNLLADALLDAGSDNAAAFGVVEPDVALQNSGGIRNNSLIPAGPITELDTFSIASFSNFVSVVPDVSREQFKEILENAVSGVPLEDGRFAQVAGFSFTYNPAGTAQVVDNDGVVLSPGSRVVDVTLDDGTPIVVGGNVVTGPAIAVATNDFSARGGDQYPFRGLPFTTVGVTYQQALLEYIVEDLNGLISAADYPEGGEGRIVP